MMIYLIGIIVTFFIFSYIIDGEETPSIFVLSLIWPASWLFLIYIVFNVIYEVHK